MTARHTPATLRIQTRLERWELDHLRALVAVQAERIEELEYTFRRADELAESWREEALQLHKVAAEATGGTPGLTVDGGLVIVGGAA